jgi:hypothetical protein
VSNGEPWFNLAVAGFGLWRSGGAHSANSAEAFGG